MKNPIEIAQEYFELSNRSDLAAIRKMFTESSTYSSVNTGVYLGVDQIMEMMTRFHSGFTSLKWSVNDVRELRPGVIEFDFVFSATGNDGQPITRPGIEYVIVHNGLLQHVEVRNK